jgi:hypothetical protein
MTRKEIIALAETYAKQQKKMKAEVIKATREYLSEKASQKTLDRLTQHDYKFMFKLRAYPNDLSLQRIADTLKSL